MRVAVQAYPGVPRVCYQQLIGAALKLSRTPRMQKMARWGWGQFSGWLHALPFEMDTGCKDAQCAKGCTPPQRMREFPPTMNCWERVLHQLAWFAARGVERATVYDHDTLVGRHIELLVPATTNLSAAANGPDAVRAGILGGLQGGLQGGMTGGIVGPYGALAGLILGAGLGAAKGVLSAEEESEVPGVQETKPVEQLPKGMQPLPEPSQKPTIESLIKANVRRPTKAQKTRKRNRGKI